MARDLWLRLLQGMCQLADTDLVFRLNHHDRSQSRQICEHIEQGSRFHGHNNIWTAIYTCTRIYRNNSDGQIGVAERLAILLYELRNRLESSYSHFYAHYNQGALTLVAKFF